MISHVKPWEGTPAEDTRYAVLAREEGGEAAVAAEGADEGDGRRVGGRPGRRPGGDLSHRPGLPFSANGSESKAPSSPQ
jgi:hypothetical protein